MSFALILFATPGWAEEPLQQRMETHWDLTAGLQTELVRGNLDVVRTIATELAALPFDGLPVEHQPRLETLRTRALALSTVVGLDAAVARTAELGAACAACHEANHAGPPLRPRAVPPEGGDDSRQDMVRHQEAADWLWLGLVAGSSSAWNQGARDLAKSSPSPELRAEAKAAVGAEGADRTAAYAAIVTRCAGCHVQEAKR
jgi:cytochrome c553